MTNFYSYEAGNLGNSKDYEIQKQTFKMLKGISLNHFKFETTFYVQPHSWKLRDCEVCLFKLQNYCIRSTFFIKFEIYGVTSLKNR